ncbi:MAG: nicotinamide-nucleotide amidohydrolase family protein [Clostridia bacterium]|nr:nicotinamide-nucleotide amidohydrolase family protein [Clostridia bacterium]
MDIETIEIRAYRREDLPSMIRIWNQVVEEGIAFPQEECLDDETGEAFFASQTFCGVAADAGGTVLGLYILHPNNVGRCGHICNASYAVERGVQGLHIGEKLVMHCLEEAGRQGFGVLQFNAVVASNVHARHLYERLGFVPLGTIPDGFRRKDGKFEDICPYYISLRGCSGLERGTEKQSVQRDELLKNVRERYAALTSALIARGITVTAMESCTSGLVASLLTDTDHASEVFRGSFVTYGNEEKIRRGVPEETIRRYGVYSEETAAAMAGACRKAFGTDIGIGVTGSLGIRDPENADSEPGRVYYAIDCFGTVVSRVAELPDLGSKFLGKVYTAGLVADEIGRLLREDGIPDLRPAEETQTF